MTTLFFTPDGRVTVLGEEHFDLGTVEARCRASHILPVHPLKRAAFRLLRALFGERGAVAEWTRTWRGPWMVIIIGSNRRFYHPSRRVCLKFEHQQLNRQITAKLCE